MNMLGNIFAVLVITLAVSAIGFTVAVVVKTHREELGGSSPKSIKACMEWVNLQRSKSRLDPDIWDERHLHDFVKEYWQYPYMHHGEVEREKAISETLAWMKDNDPSDMRARIAELERELGIR